MRLIILSILALTLSSFDYGSGAKMKVFVIDENSEVISGASVEVFATPKDYEAETNIVVSGTTNAKGFIQFKNLKEQKYYLLVKKGSLNNHQTSNETDVLRMKGKNRFEIMIN